MCQFHARVNQVSPSHRAPSKMDIPPEVLHLVGQYFRYRRCHQILVCCRVSKGWYAAFIPLLLHTLEFTILGEYSREKLPSPNVLHRHGNLVRNVTLEYYNFDRLSAGDLLAGVAMVKFLSLSFYPRDWRWLRQFVANNPGIHKLQLNNHGAVGNFSYLKDLAEVAPQVQDFSLADANVEWLTLLHFLTVCQQLLKVRLQSSKVVYTRSQGIPSIGDATLSQSVQTLEFEYLRGLTFSSCLDLAARCPRLESLEFSQAEGDTTLPFGFGDLSKIKHCTSLSTLSLVSHSLSSLQLADILGHCQTLTSLILKTDLNLESIAGMTHHLRSLETLDLSRCSFGMFEAILSQCPKLTNFTIALNGILDIGQAPFDCDGRLANTPRPWLCVGLKKLKIRSNIERLCRLWDTLANRLWG